MPHVPSIARQARLQRPRMAGAMAILAARLRAGRMISRLPKDKNSSGPVATATVIGLENWRAARSRCRVLFANALAHPPEVSSGASGPIALRRSSRSGQIPSPGRPTVA
jgi:hypothetical protein